ncbi:NADH-quinone oxidoreductase subunit A [Desulfuromonas versatilis]|uniref:NADH-quinone oxidoreductase subunit n=1 Tax=Desulfuromonas versatilis TaxID=2802975 RepID=A0ABN6E3F7_9BACT|nr:NADH-quinone oxidoreductase subunit A [Desulfuromonas versatilis]BCR05696.1 NADH-quinone oxidoreductase subunit A [Desulfuromonas versatilis]
MSPYLAFFLFLLAALGLVGLIVALNRLLGPRVAPTAVKLEPFECGSRPLQQRNVRPLSIKYYPVAIFFLLFDLETVLLFLWASSTGEGGLATASLVAFLFFMGLLALAFVYIWKEGGLEWR